MASSAPVQPREHHYIFAHRFLPRTVFESPDKVLAELRGPLADGFLLFLWQQAGQGYDEQQKPSDVGTRPGSSTPEVLSLSVLSTDEVGGWTIVTLGMPPTAAPGEAMHVAIARNALGVRYFVHEQSSTPGQGNLAEYRADGSRIAYGPQPGVMPQDFARALAGELGMSGGQSSPAPGGMFAGFPSGGGPQPGGLAQQLVAPEAAAKIIASGKLLALFLLLRGLFPVAMWLFWRVAPMLIESVDSLDLIYTSTQSLRELLTLATMITLLVWLYRLFDALRGKTKYSPGMAVGGWFIPFANLALPLMIVQDAWKALHRGQPDQRVTLWWLCFLANAGIEAAWRMHVMPFGMIVNLLSLAVSVGAFMLLYPIVGAVTQRVTENR